MNKIKTPLVGFTAVSGTGKTTLLIKLITLLADKDIRVGIIKHAHHTFDIDQPGKDSYQLRKAGASEMLIGSVNRWALMVDAEKDQEFTLEDHIQRLDQDNLDLILVEGFKLEEIPKIEVIIMPFCDIAGRDNYYGMGSTRQHALLLAVLSMLGKPIEGN